MENCENWAVESRKFIDFNIRVFRLHNYFRTQAHILVTGLEGDVPVAGLRLMNGLNVEA